MNKYCDKQNFEDCTSWGLDRSPPNPEASVMTIELTHLRIVCVKSQTQKNKQWRVRIKKQFMVLRRWII